MSYRGSVPMLWIVLALGLASGSPLDAVTIAVPADQPTIQAGLDAAQPGDVVLVAAGVYNEKIVFPRSGTPGERIVLRGPLGQRPALDGTGVAGANMVLIEDRSHVEIRGFEIRNNLGVNDGSGIRVLGSGTDIRLIDNEIYDIRGVHAMGITVYGTRPEPITELVIDGNRIERCEPAQSEALTLNGNIDGFRITRNFVQDVNSIGIDMIGGETSIQPDPTLVARNGLVRENSVFRARANYEGGYAAGIYVDGGRDIVIENNNVGMCDLGIEVGAENAGIVTTGVVVRNNTVGFNERAGLVVGGFAETVGRADGNVFRNNNLNRNNTVGEDGQGLHFIGGGIGEIWIQWGTGNVFEGNLVTAGEENVFVGSFDAGGAVGTTIDYNLYWSDAAVDGAFSLNGAGFTGLADWQAGTGLDSASLSTDPLRIGGRLTPASPARDAGPPTYVPPPTARDIYLGARLQGGRVDIGFHEYGIEPLFYDGFEIGLPTVWSFVAGEDGATP